MIGPSIERIAENSLWNVIEKKDWDRIFLPLLLLCRLDSKLSKAYHAASKRGHDHKRILITIAGDPTQKPFHNTWCKPDHFEAGTPLTWITKNSKDLPKDLTAYVEGFSKDTAKIFRTLELLPNDSTAGTINLLHSKGVAAKKEILTLLLTGLIQEIDFDSFSDTSMGAASMGAAFEDCIRLFNEQKKTDAGEHYTPRDAISLLVQLLLNGDGKDSEVFKKAVTFYDPTCGTGGILQEGEKAFRERCKLKGVSPSIELYGQELMAFTHGICQADLLMRGAKFEQIVHANTLVEDGHPDKKFRYIGANPPYGVKWKSVEKEVLAEIAKGAKGRFPAGAPKTTQEGQLLFLQHMISKMQDPKDGGGRCAVVMNGNPLFAADAGEGDSEIRGWLLKNDLVEAIVALPKDMFFNTGIATYIWVLNNNKRDGKPHSLKRIGNVQLIDASGMGTRMAKSLGSKRYELNEESIRQIAKWHQTAAGQEVDERCRLLPNEYFGYYSVDIEENPEPGQKKGKKDNERIPLLDVPNRDEQKLHERIKGMRPSGSPAFKITNVTIGWEFPFTQIFYKYEEPEDPVILGQKLQKTFNSLKLDLSFLK